MLNLPFLNQILYLLAGGFISLCSAGLALHFGMRSADRMPGESRMPHCVFCYRPIQWFEYFPLFGWLFRRNPFTLPCPCGKRKGLWPQPVVESIGFLLGASAVVISGFSWMSVPLCLGLGLLPAIAFIDLSFGIIPDELNALLGVFGISWLLIGDGDFFLGLIGASILLGFGLFMALGYSKWRGKDMLGIGDVKFFAAAGFWLPLGLMPWFLGMAGFLGAIIGILWKRNGGGREFPFGPALCVSLAGCILYQLFALFFLETP